MFNMFVSEHWALGFFFDIDRLTFYSANLSWYIISLGLQDEILWILSQNYQNNSMKTKDVFTIWLLSLKIYIKYSHEIVFRYFQAPRVSPRIFISQPERRLFISIRSLWKCDATLSLVSDILYSTKMLKTQWNNF